MRQVLTAAAVSLVLLFLAGLYLRSHPSVLVADAARQESVYDRVLRTGEIRCGYSVWMPLFFIDMKTGEKKGIFHDLMEEVGKRLGLKVIWQEELGWGTIVESVKTGRVDMACAGYWLHPDRIKYVSATSPQLYAPLYVWVRKNDNRPFASLEDLNSDRLTAGLIDGGSSTRVIATRLPKTKTLSLPEMSTNVDEAEALASGKVDFVIDDATTFENYMANNPGKIRNLFPDHPIVVFPVSMLLPPSDMRFKEVIDDTLHNIEYDGTLDDILKSYRMGGAFLRNPEVVKRP